MYVADGTHRLRVPGGWLYRWETPEYNGYHGGAAQTFVPDPEPPPDYITRADVAAMIVGWAADFANALDEQALTYVARACRNASKQP